MALKMLLIRHVLDGGRVFIFVLLGFMSNVDEQMEYGLYTILRDYVLLHEEKLREFVIEN